MSNEYQDWLKENKVERDRFLTKAMRECWHEEPTELWEDTFICPKCGKEVSDVGTNFSTWDGFGKLVEWTMGQAWWQEFIWYMNKNRGIFIEWYFIHPDRFSDILYTYLKEFEKL